MLSHRSPAAIAAALALLVWAPATQASYPGLNGKIAFHDMPGTNTSEDIYVMEPNGSGQTAITGPPANERGPVWSPDGTKIAFDLDNDVYVMNADGSGVINLTPGTFSADTSPTWSPDGSQIAFVSTRSPEFGQKIHKMDADGSDVVRVTDGLAADSQPAWSPSGQHIAFVRSGHISTVKPDGTNFTQVTSTGSNSGPDWSPSAHRIVYTRSGSTPTTAGIHTVDPDGSNDVDLAGALNEAHDPAWSPDGSKILVKKGLHVWTINPDGTSPTQITTVQGNYSELDWQPLAYPGYPRPKGASPLRVPLVPAFGQCTSPDRTHGPPLAFGSCGAPDQTSPNLTVGTPDANGAGANSVGFFKITAKAGVPGPPDDSGAPINLSLTDVRCNAALPTCGAANAGGGADYLGGLQVEVVVRMTDKLNGPGGPTYVEPGTVEDFTFRFSTSACAGTASTAEGSSCTINTDVLYLIPGVAKDGKRQIWELGQVRVLDGGPDGEADTPDNSLFAVQGVFVP